MKSKTSAASKEGKSSAKVDPELLKQINTVAASEEPVGAVVVLRSDDPSKLSASPERTEELTHKVLQRVEERVGSSAKQINVFRNLGVATVSAKPEFLRELLRQPEIASAMAHNQETRAYIPPHEVKPLKPGSTRGWASPESGKKKRGGSKAARTQSGKATRKAAGSSKSSKQSKSKK